MQAMVALHLKSLEQRSMAPIAPSLYLNKRHAAATGALCHAWRAAYSYSGAVTVAPAS
jgi:hypothetical protein